MKKIIKKKTYNTDTADLIQAITFGEFGEETGYEEKLYQTKKGDYFLYGYGGYESKYAEETIIPFTTQEAESWLKENK